jgi:hypothetical protein
MSDAEREWIIGLRHPLVFDRRSLPSNFLGLRVHASVSDIPPDFLVFASYVWAPENYEHLVDAHADEVRRMLGDVGLSRKEALHALCGMPFEDWVDKCRSWGSNYTGR